MRVLSRRLSVRARLTVWYASLLLAILLVISAFSYGLLRRSLIRDVDASLQVVAHVVRDTAYSPADRARPGPEAAVREILGPGFADVFFQLVEPLGGPVAGASQVGGRPLPLSEAARRNAAKGQPTFETLQLVPGERVRLLTMPLAREGRLVQLVQVGESLQDAERTLLRYLETLLVLVPVGVTLAAAGGAAIARAALRPIAEISRTARRITAEDLSLRIPARLTGDEVDHLVDTLNAMLGRLDDAFAQIRRFTADAAHELRTPLAALRGGIEVALRAPRSVEEHRRVLQSSLEDVERLIRLAEDLLLLSRTSADIGAGVGPARQRVELESIVLDVLDVGTQLAHGTGVSLRLEDCAPAVVVGDAADLRRAVLNLVDNAVKYTPAGGKVEVGLRLADGWASIVVRDTGPGIDPADAERIFQPFVRLEAARARASGGSGLGLSIARSIVLVHGGVVTLTSTPGVGSEFAIRLPVADGTSPRLGRSDPETSPADAVPSPRLARSALP